MKFSLAVSILAIIVAVVSAGDVSQGGNNNEGATSGILNNLLKSGILTGNDKNSDSTIVSSEDRGRGYGY